MPISFFSSPVTPESIGGTRSWTPSGAAETFPRDAVFSGAAFATTAGRVYLSRIYLRAKSYTTVTMMVGPTGTATATNAWIGVYDVATGTRRAQVDVTAALNALSAGYEDLVATMNYTVATPQDHWMAFLVGGGAQPTMAMAEANIGADFWAGIGERHNTGGLAALPATVTTQVAGGNLRLWFRYA